jgi:DNA-binding protein H-NS
MKTPNIKGMSFDALVDLRNRIENQMAGMATKRRAELENQLAWLDGLNGRAAPRKIGRGKSLKGRKVPPKYRNPKNRAETWAGRGAMPRWLAAMVKSGKKAEDFLIAKAAGTAKAVKNAGRKKKR